MSVESKITQCCRLFLKSLGDNATDGDVFVILANVADEIGLQLQAYQRGISGTYIVLVDSTKEQQ